MLLVPASARNFLDPADYRRDWTTYGSMMIRRQVAVRTLLPAFADLGRLGIGALAWAAAVTGATLLRAGVGGGTALGLTGTAATVVATPLLLVGAAVGILVLVTGARLSHGLVLWALMPRLVRPDGSRRAPGSAPDAAPGDGWDGPAASLAPRLLAAVVAAVAAVMWTVDVVRDALTVRAPYSTGADLVVLLASVVGAGVSWTAAVAGWRGWHRVRCALDGRVGPAGQTALLRKLHGPAATPVRASPAPVPVPHRSDVVQVRIGGRLLGPGTTLVGRDPSPRPGELIDHTLAVDDPTMSKTHLAVRVTTTGVWASDRSSTNGTTLVTDRGEHRLRPWEETEVPPGALLRAGTTEIRTGGQNDEIEQTVLR